MSATPPPSYTPPPADLPQRGIRATFSNLMDAWITWFSNTSLVQVAALAANAYTNALDAFASATTASAQAAAALAAVDALPWSAGSYSAGAVRYSLVDGRTYRCYVAVSGSTDPANDRPHWVCASPGPLPYLQVQDQRTSGTSGVTSTASAWNTRAINTTIGANTIPSATVASNQITLPAGEYDMQASGQAFANHHKLALYNVTDSTFTLNGMSADGSTSVAACGTAEVHGRFSITAQKVFELRHFTSGAGPLGQPVSSGQPEVYLDAQFWKVD